MTNKDKYLKDNVSVEEMRKSFFDYLISDGVYGCNSKNIVEKWENFLNKEIQPTLTEDERVILRNLRDKYKYIGKEGTLYIAEQERNSQFVSQVAIDEYKPDLFQFIKERRRIRDKGAVK